MGKHNPAIHPNDETIDSEVAALFAAGELDDLLGSASAPANDEERSHSGHSMVVTAGSRATGRVASVSSDSVLIEFGPKQQGVCPVVQFGDNPPAVGDDIEVTVQRFDRGEDVFVVNRIGTVQKAEWDNLEEGQLIEARCTGKNAGGLEMEVAGHRAFMPAGQVSIWRVENLEELIGQQLTCEVVEFNRKARNIVLSRRTVLERERREERERTLASLEVGNVIEGTVRRIMPFGAFVDIGGVDGLVHISDLAYERVRDANDVVKEGQRVKVQVLSIDPDSDKISLGMKQLQDDPLTATLDSLQEGATVTGRVTRIAAFGAFVELTPGVEGLIHISELSHDRVTRVSQIVKEDEIITVKILNVDPDTRRIGLSLRALSAEQDTEEPRAEDAALRKLKARFGSDQQLKGGIG
jgi:small subunit ribosomal protein S1